MCLGAGMTKAARSRAMRTAAVRDVPQYEGGADINPYPKSPMETLADSTLREAGFAATARDPMGLDAHHPGAKLDDGKLLSGVLEDFSLALTAVAEVGTYGANKYSRGGWQLVLNGIVRYTDAFWRHLLAMRHEERDPESGLLHHAHRVWNDLAILELKLREQRKKGE